MNKKIIIPIIIVIILVIGFFVYMFLQNNTNNNDTQNDVNSDVTQDESNNDASFDNNVNNNGSSVVVYFSATGNTERVANLIGEATGSNVIEITPEEAYTDEDLNYSDDNCRANLEQNDDSARPGISNEINVDSYDTIYLGYPIWWGDIPKIILTFIDTHNLDGKTIVPFCTSGSSGISTSVSTLRDYNSNMNVLEGRRFSSSEDIEDVTNWISELGL